MKFVIDDELESPKKYKFKLVEFNGDISLFVNGHRILTIDSRSGYIIKGVALREYTESLGKLAELDMPHINNEWRTS